MRVLSKSSGDKVGLSLRRNTGKPNQHNTRLGQALTENKLAKVLVRREQNCVSLAALKRDGLVVDSRIELSYRLNTVPISAKTIDNLSIYALVCDDIQLTCSKG